MSNYKIALSSFLTYCFTSLSLLSNATIVSGTVSNEKNYPLPFAAVYVQNTTNGTNTNADGKYSIDLKPGEYTLVFQYLGYTKQIKTITVGDNPATINVQLLPENINLQEVVISAGGKDPAYAIIHNAQKKRSYYLTQVNGYTCDAYIKEVWRLDSASSRFLFLKVDTSEFGKHSDSILYLSESQSQYNFQRPDNVKEIMYSSRVSGDQQAFSWNEAGDFKINFYNDLIDIQSLSSRGFVSPISGSAMFYYDYKLLGSVIDGGRKIYKIKVTPKRGHDPVFSGTIYITDKSWRIYGTDLILTKDANIDYVDTLRIKQTYEPVTDTVWMPVFQNYFFRFKLLGLIWGDGNITGIFKDYTIDPVFPPHFFNNEKLKVTEGANKKDSSYWTSSRPVQLSRSEKKDYRKKDSIETAHNAPAYKDSLEKLANKFNLIDLIYGYTYHNYVNNYNLYFSTLGNMSYPLGNINYNTVEGLNIQEDISYNKQLGDSEAYTINGAARYGFSDKLASTKLEGAWNTNMVTQSVWSAGGGKFVQQINGDKPILEQLNTYYSLLGEENYMKIYDDAYFFINHERELFNGFKLNASITYSDRMPLENTTVYNWAKASDAPFTPNEPQYANGYATINQNNALLLRLTATIRFKQQYVSFPHKKVIVGSKFPVLTISYSEGIPAFGTTANYEVLEAGIKGNYRLGLLGTSAFSIKAGDFLNQTNLSFIDYFHFMGNQTNFAHDYLEGFQLLPYYQYSTNQQFIQAHYEQHFEGFILNKIPLLRALKLQEVAGIHLLETPDIRYAELDLGIEHIYKFFRIDWVNSYSNTLHLRNGLLLGITGFFGMN